MTTFKVMPNPNQEEHPLSAACLECDWMGLTKDCDTDYYYDEFWGYDRPYPICPECGEGVEVS